MKIKPVYGANVLEVSDGIQANMVHQRPTLWS